ncbi:MAG: glycosyltransferase family 4 protein [Desulfobacterales bacterium]|nr:glycosyltransferase family 4 protein [Desulfobacterales bacterium]
MGLNAGFISTRFSGIDGVSLEASKWCKVIENQGHQCYWFAGQLDRDEKVSFLARSADFNEHQICAINDQLFGKQQKTIKIAKTIHQVTSFLATQLKAFIGMYDIDFLVVQNSLALPMNIPLGLALADVIAETRIPTIAHHHDFYWERQRYLPLNGNKMYIHKAFPPKLPGIKHVVINSGAKRELARRREIDSMVIPNVLDFDNPPPIDTERVKAFRQSIELKPDHVMVLQPTRIVERKGIELSVDLVKALGPEKHKLVITHEAGDEGFAYARQIQTYAYQQGVDIRYVDRLIKEPFYRPSGKNRPFSLWEAYQAADLVTYPSRYEGFGNALVEAIYFKKPLLVNRYKVFVDDIEPLGFKFLKVDGHLNRRTVHRTEALLADRKSQAKMVNHNYRIAREHYSFATLDQQLSSLLSSLAIKDQDTECRTAVCQNA